MVIVFIVLVVFVSFIYGFYNMDEFELEVELKLLNNPYYRIGVYFEKYVIEDVIVEEISIGLFFVNINLLFYKYAT